MRRALSWIVLIIALVPLCLVFLRFFGMRSSGYLIAVTLVYAACIIGLALIARRATLSVWLVAGVLVLLGLFVPTEWLMENSGSPLNVAETISKITLFIWPSIALIMAAVLLYFGFDLLGDNVKLVSDGQIGSPTAWDSSGRMAAAYFVLSGLLILKTLSNLYWLTVWDTTYDPLGYIWITVPVLAGFFSGILLIINLRGRVILAGLVYWIAVPGLIIAVSTHAQRVDYRQVTEMRAEQVSQRVEAYYARQGRYPTNLRHLMPWYAFPLPEPMIIYGQDWCYQAGDEYYQLGYVYREHWSSPELIRRVYKTVGDPLDPNGICAEDIEALIQRESFFYEP
jgi:hypothetical protein